MKFNCGPTREEKRLEKKHREYSERQRLMDWHRCFTWLPTRVGKVCIWLEMIERRYPKARKISSWNQLECSGYYSTRWYWDKPEYRLLEKTNAT